MATRVSLIERSTAEDDRAIGFDVDWVEVKPPVYHERKRDDGTVQRTETMAERIVLVGVSDADMKAIEGTKWTGFAFDKAGQRVEGAISAIETTGNDRLTFRIDYV